MLGANTNITLQRGKILCFNSHIKIDRQVVFYKQWYEAGIIYVRHIIKQNGTILKYEDFVSKYHIHPNRLQYYGIIHSIPCKWKYILKNVGESTKNKVISRFDKVKQSSKVCKTVSNDDSKYC